MADRVGLRSMTGFGSSRVEARAGEVDLTLEVEVRSVNHRHLKINSRVPESLLGLIPKLEELVREHASRGTVYLQVRQGSQEVSSTYQLDPILLRRFYRELNEAAQELGAEPPNLGQVALIPGVVREQELTLEAQSAWPGLKQGVSEALAGLSVMRAEEGAGIAADLLGVLETMLTLADRVEAGAPQAVREQGERMQARVALLLSEADVDPQALAREVAVLADKSDIAEELQRLRSHAAQMRAALTEASGPVGRKLEFLSQELVREANTMANKTHDADLVGIVLEIKLCVEKLREQLANVE